MAKGSVRRKVTVNSLQYQVDKILSSAKDYYSENIIAICGNDPYIWEKGTYSDEEIVQMMKEFKEYAENDFDHTDYLTERQSIEECFISVVKNHHYPEEKYPEAVDGLVVRYCEYRIQGQLDIAKRENYQGELPALGENDLDTVDMAYLFARIPYIKEDDEFCESIGVTYDYDQLHMSVWFSAQVTMKKGPYSRSVPNHSARTTYNRLLNPYSLLWICTILGEDKELLRKAAEEMETKGSPASKCAVIRKYVPFDRVLELAKAIMKPAEED